MNDLHDLRRTLDAHSHTVEGQPHAVTRMSELKARIAMTQRRRNATRAGVGAFAVIAVIGGGFAVTSLGDDKEEPGPANTTFGAPQHFSAAGWNYAFADAVKSDDTMSTISLEASKYARLLSWKTDGAGQDVKVTSLVSPDDVSPIWWSSADDWSDYVVIQPGQAEEVTVSASGGDVDAVAVAVYEIDMADLPAAEGADEPGPLFFRKTVEDRVLLATAITEPGESDATQEFTGAQNDLVLAFSCQGLPKKAMVYVSLDGSDQGAGAGGACHDDDTEVDPGANSRVSWTVKRDRDRSGTLRVWATLDDEGRTPLTAADYPEMKLGAAVYTSTEASDDVLGMDVSPRVTSSGHEWQVADQVQVSGGTPVRLDSLAGADGYDGPWLVESVQTGPGKRISFHLEGDDTQIHGTHTSDTVGGTSMLGEVLIAPTTETVRSVVTEGGGSGYRQTLVFYRLAD